MIRRFMAKIRARRLERRLEGRLNMWKQIYTIERHGAVSGQGRVLCLDGKAKSRMEKGASQ